MSINNSGGPPPSTASSIWREVLSARTSATQEQINWKVGEVLAARVQALLPAEAGTPEKPATANQTRLILEIGGRLMETTTSLPVKTGDILQAIVQTSQPLLLQLGTGTSTVVAALKALLPSSLLEPSQPQARTPFTPPTPTQPQVTIPTVQEALGRVMPFQGPLLETLGKLMDMAPGKLTPATEQALQQVRAAIPQAKELFSAEGLKQAFKQSGAFSEAQLANQVSPHQSATTTATGPAQAEPKDLKYALIKLFAALSRPPAPQAPSTFGAPASAAPSPPLSPPWQPVSSHVAHPLLFPHPEFLKANGAGASRKEELTTGEILKLIAQALSRIQTTQLNAAQQLQAGTDATAVNTWMLEVPVFANQQLNLFQARIEEEHQQGKSERDERKAESIWRITLSFNLEPLGPMYSLVKIQQGRVSSTFWAEKDSTKRLLDRELPQLRKALVNLGLDVEALEALQGQPSFTQTKLETRLIDVRT